MPTSLGLREATAFLFQIPDLTADIWLHVRNAGPANNCTGDSVRGSVAYDDCALFICATERIVHLS